jgi:hypothetical protein
VRDWFYYQARQGTADRFRLLAKPGQTVIAIGELLRHTVADMRYRGDKEGTITG